MYETWSTSSIGVRLATSILKASEKRCSVEDSVSGSKTPYSPGHEGLKLIRLMSGAIPMGMKRPCPDWWM